ncbi:MAG: heme-binding protein [Planctomycetota bacterium]
MPTLRPLAALAGLLALMAPSGMLRAAEPETDLLARAQADPRLLTFVTAVEAAGLADALRGSGPFTVFAPTDEAFEALPPGALAGLLADPPALAAVLQAHVVAGALRARDLRPVATARTLGGGTWAIGLTVGPARVLAVDLEARNGVLHVIDQVLVPTARTTPPAQPAFDLDAALVGAIDRGAPLYNRGDHAGCAAVYEAIARDAIAAADGVGAWHRQRLMAVLDEQAASPSDRAWALRHAFDAIRADLAFRPLNEAPLPEGFPEAGPVGQIVEKTYPRYRAARARGGEGSFFTLFGHIQRNDVEMTAPVEMTLDGGARAVDMAFLYESPRQGRAGAQGRVDVVDLDRQSVLSLALRGRRSTALVAEARALLEAELAQHGLKATGAFRVLAYNSPMVPAERQLFEVQVPVARNGD